MAHLDVSWAASRCGVHFVDGARNQRDACKAHGTLIPVAEGRATFGALLFRIDEHPGKDHVAISLGNGHTFEARGKDFGVNIFSTAGRKWTQAGFVPGLERGEPDLTQGGRGADVRWVQRRLLVHGVDPGPADGVFGPHTGAAVCAFPKSRGLTVDGVVGAKTRAALAEPVHH